LLLFHRPRLLGGIRAERMARRKVLRDETGDFGELVYAGMDWVDPALAKRSMTLLAEQVMPRVNEAIGKQAAAE
jgi:hypothetical protein